jgi:hypothetical protein
MNTNIINEELNRIRLMMGYNSKKTLTENYNSVDKIELKEFGGKAAIETMFKDLAKAEGNVVKGALETMIKDGKGVKMRVGSGKGFISTDVEQILKAMKGEGGVILKDGAMDLSRQFMKQPELRKNAAEGIAAMDSFAQKFGNQQKEFIVKDLMKGPGKYSKEEAELIANAYVKNRSLPGEVIKTTEKGVGTGVKDSKAAETGVKDSKAAETGVKDAKAAEGGTEATASATGKGTGTGTGTGTGGSATAKGGNQTINFTPEINVNIGSEVRAEMKNMSQAEAESYLKSVEKGGKKGPGRPRCKPNCKKIQTDIKNNKALQQDLKVVAEQSPSKFKVWLNQKGILQKTIKWTVGNKWFWIIGGSTVLGYLWWKNWADKNDITIIEEEELPIDDNIVQGGGETDPNQQQQIDDFVNNTDTFDGGPNDPLKGKYRDCGDGPFKLGCMTTPSSKHGDLVGNLQANLSLNATGKWGYKTEAELLDREGKKELSLTNMQNR